MKILLIPYIMLSGLSSVELDELYLYNQVPNKLLTLSNNYEVISTDASLDDYYKKIETDDLLLLKSDKATTYTKTETDDLLLLKSDKLTTYTKTETDDLLLLKSDKLTTYTKIETDDLLLLKSDKATTYTKVETNSALVLKADKTSVYDKIDIDIKLYQYAPQATTYTKDEANYLYSLKVDTTVLTTALNSYFTTTEINTILNNYFTKTNINDILTSYPTTQFVSDNFIDNTEFGVTVGIIVALQTAVSGIQGAMTIAEAAQSLFRDTTYAALDQAEEGIANVTNTAVFASASAVIATSVATGLIATAIAEVNSNVFNKAEVNNALSAKVDTTTLTSTYYTKTENDAHRNLLATSESPTFTGTVSGITKTMVGLGNVDNTSDLLKPLSTASIDALALKLSISTASTTYATIANLNSKSNTASPTFTTQITTPQILVSNSGTLTFPALRMIGKTNQNTGFNVNGISTATSIAVINNGVINFEISGTTTSCNTVLKLPNSGYPAPSLIFGSSATSGFYSPSTNVLGVVISGQSVMTFDSTKIQTTYPLYSTAGLNLSNLSASKILLLDANKNVVSASTNITDYTTTNDLNVMLSGKVDTNILSNDYWDKYASDARYYTQSATDTLLNDKASLNSANTFFGVCAFTQPSVFSQTLQIGGVLTLNTSTNTYTLPSVRGTSANQVLTINGSTTTWTDGLSLPINNLTTTALNGKASTTSMNLSLNEIGRNLLKSQPIIVMQMGADAGSGSNPMALNSPTVANCLYTFDGGWLSLYYLPLASVVESGSCFYFYCNSSYGFTVNKTRTDMAVDLVVNSGFIAIFMSNGTTFNYICTVPKSYEMNAVPINARANSFKMPTSRPVKNQYLQASDNSGNTVWQSVLPTGATAPVMSYNSTTGQMYYNSSSRRYKKNIQRKVIDADALLDIEIVEFDSIETNEHFPCGVIAEQCGECNEDFIWRKDGIIEGVNQIQMLLYSIVVLKKQRKVIEQLQTENEELKARIIALESVKKKPVEKLNEDLQARLEKMEQFLLSRFAGVFF